jgi:hypothetical protein
MAREEALATAGRATGAKAEAQATRTAISRICTVFILYSKVWEKEKVSNSW